MKLGDSQRKGLIAILKSPREPIHQLQWEGGRSGDYFTRISISDSQDFRHHIAGQIQPLEIL
jgi:hypothetical protein